jgi:ESF2/ABP1 family protein
MSNQDENEKDNVNGNGNTDFNDDDAYLFGGEEIDDVLENNKDFKEKIRRTGVIYVSHIPEGMNVNTLREKLEDYGPLRIYLVPDNSSKQGDKRQNYKEGWVEFSDKIMAKLCEYEFNGKMIGGKKRNNNFREELWTIKYLHKFKWHNLMEKLNFNKKVREQKIKAEISQSNRETNFIIEKYEHSKNLNRKRKRVI